MRKALLPLAFIMLLCFVFLFTRTSLFSAYTLTMEPSSISKGSYGHSLVAEVSYSPPHFSNWLKSYSGKDVLFLLAPDWIQRSPIEIKHFLSNDLSTGILVSTTASQAELNSSIKLYEQVFQKHPLWTMCSPEPCTDEIITFFYSKKINVVSPLFELKNIEQLETLEDGAIISTPFSRDHSLELDDLNLLIQHPFISIEQNLLGLSVKTKRYP